MNQDRLKEVPIFAKLNKKELAMIAQHADELDVPAGKVLVREGELGHEFFVIESGTAEVVRGDRKVMDMGPGDFFGEIALLVEDRRLATVTATSPMTVIVMTRADFRSADTLMPDVHAQIAQAIEERMAAR
jgi:CRP-like cAMP-binding protein